jgi:disulfide bond formation protein DsbB
VLLGAGRRFWRSLSMRLIRYSVVALSLSMMLLGIMVAHIVLMPLPTISKTATSSPQAAPGWTTQLTKD